MRDLGIPKGNDRCSCPKTGAWLTRESAKRRLKAIRAKKTRRKKPVRVYECEEGLFHLTSQTWEQREEREKRNDRGRSDHRVRELAQDAEAQ